MKNNYERTGMKSWQPAGVADNFQRLPFLRAARLSTMIGKTPTRRQWITDWRTARPMPWYRIYSAKHRSPQRWVQIAICSPTPSPEGHRYLDTIIKPCRRVYVIAGKPGTNQHCCGKWPLRLRNGGMRWSFITAPLILTKWSTWSFGLERD